VGGGAGGCGGAAIPGSGGRLCVIAKTGYRIARHPTHFLKILRILKLQIMGGLRSDLSALAQGFLSVARQDTTAARALYEVGILNLAVYHLSQAAEKATKAYFLMTGMSNPKDVRKAGHDPYELVIRLAEQKRVSDFVADLCTVAEVDALISPSDARSKLAKNRVKIARLPANDIDELMRIADAVESKMASTWNELGWAVSMVRFSRYDLTLIKGLVHAHLRLLLLGLVTFPHDQSTRYPDQEPQPHEYIPSLGIVCALPTLCDQMELIISILNEVCTKLDSSCRRCDRR